MRKLHDSIETNRLKVQVRLENGDYLTMKGQVDQVYVSENGKHAIIHSVLPSGKRRIDTYTNVDQLVIEGA